MTSKVIEKDSSSEKIYDKPIKSVIFDCDGVLLDTMKLYVKVNGMMIGQPYPDYMKAKTRGRSDLDAGKIIVDEFKLNMTPKEFSDKRNAILEKEFINCKQVEGVFNVVKQFKEKKLPIGVATSASRGIHEVKMTNHKELFDMFDYIVCGDEVARAKPAPDLFETCAKKISNAPPENTLVFEDAAYGVKAANTAGMPVVLLWVEDTDPIPLMESVGAKPTYIIKKWSDLDICKFFCF